MLIGWLAYISDIFGRCHKESSPPCPGWPRYHGNGRSLRLSILTCKDGPIAGDPSTAAPSCYGYFQRLPNIYDNKRKKTRKAKNQYLNSFIYLLLYTLETLFLLTTKFIKSRLSITFINFKLRTELTSVFAQNLAVGDEFSDEVERRRCRRRLVHVTKQLRPTKLPLDVRLTLDLLVGVRHHGDEQVDKHDNGNDQKHSEDRFHQWNRPPRVPTQRRQVPRVHQSKQREKQHLKGRQRSPGDNSSRTVSVTEVRDVGGRRRHRQVDSSHLERESQQKDDKHEQEQNEVLHHFSDNNGPGTEEVVEGEEIHELDEAEEHGEGVELVARVHESQSCLGVKEHRYHVNKHAHSTHAYYHHLNSNNTSSVPWPKSKQKL